MAISAIQLGNSFTNANGTTVLGGISSGLNPSSIIDSLVSGQTAQVTKLQDQITVNNSQASALGTLQQLLTQLQSTTAALALPQSPDSSSNVFALRTISVVGNTTLPASSFLTATVSPSTTTGTYTISNITQTAMATTQESNAFSLPNADTSVVAASPTAGMFSPGTITFKSGATITLTAGETLNQVAAAFNAVTTGANGTGITASVVQTASGTPNNTYKLVFTGTNTGLANAFNLSPPYGGANTVTSDPSGALTNITFATDQAAQDALFKFNGVSVDRASNTVSDLVSGVTFNLLQNTNGQTNPAFTVTVAPDTTGITNGITNFVNAYNNFLNFYAQQTQIDPTTGLPVKTAVLYSDTTLRSIFNQESAYAASIVSGLGGGVNTLAGIGINFGNVPATSTNPAVPNVLQIDTTTLTNAINTNLAGVENIFGYVATSSSSKLAVFQGPTNQTISSFTVNVDQIGNNYTAVYTDSGGVQHTVNLTKSVLGSGGLSLSAPSSSGLAGLVLIYADGTSQSNISVTTTNGVANQMNINLLSVTGTGGAIATDQQAIATKTSTTQTQITNINNQITTQRNMLLKKFSALEAAIAIANSSLNFLNSQQVANLAGH